MLHLSPDILPTPYPYEQEKDSSFLEKWVPPQRTDEGARKAMTFQSSDGIKNIVIAHGFKNTLPDASLEARVVHALCRFFSGDYDRLLLSGGLIDLQKPFSIQAELAYEYLKNCLSDSWIEEQVEQKKLSIHERFVEPVRGSKEVIFDNERDLMVTADGNSFVHEWREIVAKFPDLELVTSPMENVLFRMQRVKKVGREAISIGQKHHLLRSPKTHYEVTAHPSPAVDLLHNFYYEAISGLIYAAPPVMRDSIIEFLRRKA